MLYTGKFFVNKKYAKGIFPMVRTCAYTTTYSNIQFMSSLENIEVDVGVDTECLGRVGTILFCSLHVLRCELQYVI